MRRLARQRGKITLSTRRGCSKCTARKAEAKRRAAKAAKRAEAKTQPAETAVTPAPVGKKAAKALRKADKRTAKAIKKGEFGAVTPGNAKKIIRIAKIVGPVLAPFALRAASSLRSHYDRSRARRLGVPVDDLGRFTGHGAALHARIAGDTAALRDLREVTTDEDKGNAEKYAEQAETRLAQLTSAVRAAERMPTQRRRCAHRAVDQELSRLESELLTRFGVPTG